MEGQERKREGIVRKGKEKERLRKGVTQTKKYLCWHIAIAIISCVMIVVLLGRISVSDKVVWGYTSCVPIL